MSYGYVIKFYNFKKTLKIVQFLFIILNYLSIQAVADRKGHPNVRKTKTQPLAGYTL